MTSPYTSFSEDRTKTGKFSEKRNKVLKTDLDALVESVDIRVLYPDDVARLMSEAGMKKKDIRGILDQMNANREVLVEGQIPSEFIKAC